MTPRKSAQACCSFSISKRTATIRGIHERVASGAFVSGSKKRTGKYPDLRSEYRLRQMLSGSGATAAHRAVLSNCCFWIAN